MIVLTRPEQDSEIFAQELESSGFETFIEPMLSIAQVPHDPPDLTGYQALVFTSANAARHYNGAYDLPVFTVGEKTASALPVQETYNAKSDAAGLCDLIRANIIDTKKPLLHIRGRDVAFDMAEALSKEDITLDPLVVYEAKKTAELSERFLSGLRHEKYEAITFFSKRTAENFMRLADHHDVTSDLRVIKVLSISETVLMCVHSELWKETYIADNPDRKSMLDMIKRVCS